jgi:hypothetical protein
VGKKKASSAEQNNGSAANFGVEELWLAADKLRNNMDAAEYALRFHSDRPGCGMDPNPELLGITGP